MKGEVTQWEVVVVGQMKSSKGGLTFQRWGQRGHQQWWDVHQQTDQQWCDPQLDHPEQTYPQRTDLQRTDPK